MPRKSKTDSDDSNFYDTFKSVEFGLAKEWAGDAG